jgi:hypothetical protein
MKNFIRLLLFFLFVQVSLSQTLVSSYPFPYYNPYNYFWGITQRNDTLWIGTDFDGSGYPFSMLYKVTKTGNILDSLITPLTFDHGLAWDGSGFWIAEDYRTNGARIYKINLLGQKIDSIITGSYAGGIGGIAIDGNNLWFAVYYPDNVAYPYTYAYKMNLSTKTLVDTIPLRGKQVQGIAVKGDTILYVNDNFQSEQERIYAYRKIVGDTLFSFPAPDPDNDCDPRGMYWDGSNLWLIAYRIGNNVSAYRTLYKYSLSGAGSPQITTSTNSIDFGPTIIGQTGHYNLMITNSGTAKLIISNFNITNPKFGINPSATPDTINPGLSKNYDVTFTPTVFDTTSGELRISSNDGGIPVKVVNLKGKGVFSGPTISLSVSSINYSNRRLNSLCGGYINVTNTGTQPLIISNVTFLSSRFRLDTLNNRLPITIDTQKTKIVRIWFNPNALTNFSDTATIISNAVNIPVAKVSLAGVGQVSGTTLGDVMWEGNIPPNPLTTSQDYQPRSLKQINDVNGDGVNDMIDATENYWTICFNGNSSVTADTLWKFNTYFGTNSTGSVDWQDAMQIRDDVDGDGIQDVVIGCTGGNDLVYTLSGRTGKRIWAYGDSTNNYKGDINGLRCDKDYNNDNIKDVIIAASGDANMTGRHSLICVNGATGQEIFVTVLNYNFLHDVVNLNNGGAIDYSNNGGPYGVSGFNNTGILTWNYSVTSTVWSMKDFPDINSDGVRDVIGMYGFSGALFAISGANGTQLWTAGLGSSNNGTIELLDDKDKNGFIDLINSGPQSANRIDSKTGQVLWTFSPGASYLRDVDMLGDVSGDTLAEVLISTQQPGRVYVLNGFDGQVKFQFEFGPSLNERADRVRRLNSIDGNTTNEFVGCCRDGRIKCFSGGTINPIGIKKITENIPVKFNLYQNYPNPFNPKTIIKFDIPSIVKSQTSNVKLTIFDVIGREVSTLVNELMQPGSYQVEFDGTKISSGIYFYKIEAGDFVEVKKMILNK